MIHIDKEKCKGCGLCISTCSKNVIEMSKEYNKAGNIYAELCNVEKCTACGNCFRMCPDIAISIIIEDIDKDFETMVSQSIKKWAKENSF